MADIYPPSMSVKHPSLGFTSGLAMGYKFEAKQVKAKNYKLYLTREFAEFSAKKQWLLFIKYLSHTRSHSETIVSSDKKGNYQQSVIVKRLKH